VEVQFIRTIGILFCLLILGMPIPWAFSLTVNRVLPWIEISKTSDKYTVATFTVEKAFYNPGRGPKGSRSSWSVHGLIDTNTPAKFFSGDHFYTGKIYTDAQELEAEFPSGKKIVVLYNQGAKASSSLRILNYNKNLSDAAAHGVVKICLFAYGPLVLSSILIATWLYYRRHRKTP
jgi:hypothetical protein